MLLRGLIVVLFFVAVHCLTAKEAVELASVARAGHVKDKDVATALAAVTTSIAARPDKRDTCWVYVHVGLPAAFYEWRTVEAHTLRQAYWLRLDEELSALGYSFEWSMLGSKYCWQRDLPASSRNNTYDAAAAAADTRAAEATYGAVVVASKANISAAVREAIAVDPVAARCVRYDMTSISAEAAHWLRHDLVHKEGYSVDGDGEVCWAPEPWVDWAYRMWKSMKRWADRK